MATFKNPKKGFSPMWISIKNQKKQRSRRIAGKNLATAGEGEIMLRTSQSSGENNRPAKPSQKKITAPHDRQDGGGTSKSLHWEQAGRELGE